MLPVSASDDVGGAAVQQQQQFLQQHSRSKGNFSIAAIMGHHLAHESRPFEERSPPIRRSSVDPSAGKLKFLISKKMKLNWTNEMRNRF